MLKKLTLTIDGTVVKNAKAYAKAKDTSLSKMVEFYLKHVSEEYSYNDKKLPPITRSLLGIAESKQTKTDKELLTDALKKKHL